MQSISSSALLNVEVQSDSETYENMFRATAFFQRVVPTSDELDHALSSDINNTELLSGCKIGMWPSIVLIQRGQERMFQILMILVNSSKTL